MKISIKFRIVLYFILCVSASAQTETFSEVTVTDRILMSGNGARGLHLTTPFGASANPITNTSSQGLLLWNGGRRSFFSGYYHSSDITNELLSTNYSAAFGFRSLPIGRGAFAVGYMTVASMDAVAGGRYSEALGVASIAVGNTVRAEDTGSVSLGYRTKALGYAAVALGHYSEALGRNSFAAGNHAFASGSHSVALGSSNDATGQYSFAAGRFSLASGNTSSAHGLGPEALHQNTFVVGRYNDPLSGVSGSDRPMFIVGNGSTNTNRSNALEVRYNGEVHIQKIPPKGGISMGNFQ